MEYAHSPIGVCPICYGKGYLEFSQRIITEGVTTTISEEKVRVPCDNCQGRGWCEMPPKPPEPNTKYD
jgi:RecJ-like exonuclease